MDTMTEIHKYIPNYDPSVVSVEPMTLLGTHPNPICGITGFNGDMPISEAGIKHTSILDSIKKE